MVIEKTQIELYKVRLDGGQGWADISIDAKEKSGRIQIASDWGAWQYYWGACESSFKEFLIGLDIHYTAGKFGTDRFFDQEKTLKLYKDCIEELHQFDIDQERKNRCISELKRLEEQSGTKEEFVAILHECRHLMNLFEYCPEILCKIEPGFQNFWDKIWVGFTKHLQEEIG
jgi:hypothetical protein